MCTALTYNSDCFYFGRNLDLDIEYGEKVTIMPRNFIFPMRCTDDIETHYAIIGMAVTAKGCPLFFEGTNEKGLSMAGLNFPNNAFYRKPAQGKLNLAPYELIPWILGKCGSISEVRALTENLNIIDIPFSESFPLSPLHWIISDRNTSLTLESTKEGLKVYENEWGVLANSPAFDFHRINAEKTLLLGEPLPGDFSSESRFVRAAYLKKKSSPKKGEEESVGQFFRMLSLVSVPEGCVLKNGKPHYTRYACCCNTDKGIFYYKRCNSYKVNKVDMHSFNLNAEKIITP